MRYFEPDFGGWVRDKLGSANPPIKMQKLAIATELNYPYLSRLLNSGKNGKPIRPDPHNVEAIAEGLIKLGLGVTKEEAFLEAGYRVEGYRCVSEDQLVQTGAITDADRRRLAVLHRDPVIRELVDRSADTVAVEAIEQDAPEHDQRTAAERAAGVPAVKAQPLPPTRQGQYDVNRDPD